MSTVQVLQSREIYRLFQKSAFLPIDHDQKTGVSELTEFYPTPSTFPPVIFKSFPDSPYTTSK